MAAGRRSGPEATQHQHGNQEETMPESVYKVIELVGSSSESWEKAAAAAVATAAKSLRDLRVAEVTTLDMHLENGKVTAYRARVKVSFKYEGEK
jgi:flavin-binding protein dodecin